MDSLGLLKEYLESNKDYESRYEIILKECAEFDSRILETEDTKGRKGKIEFDPDKMGWLIEEAVNRLVDLVSN